ncbi:MAG: hypothetical protein ACWA5Q_08370 [bacterium]
MNKRLALTMLLTAMTTLAIASPGRFVMGLTKEQKAMADQLPVYQDANQAGQHSVLGAVQGISCMATYDDDYTPSEKDAMQELKRATLKKGGNALAEPSCQSYGVDDAKRGCFKSVICDGMAIRQ